MRSVLVTRPQPAADEFAEKLRRDGYTAYIAPMMEYAAVAADLGDLASYQALVFTSAQAVQVFCGLSAERKQPILAVGDATAAAAKKAGFAHIHSARGNSQDVAALIKAENLKLNLKKILHLCSADTTDDIGAEVAKAGVEVVRRIVYKAELVNTIPEDIVAALQRGTIDTVMLFSARTAGNFVRLMIAKGLRNVCPRLEVICISDAVAGALRELPWRAIRIARQPRMEAVMQILHEQDKLRKKAQDRRHKQDRRKETMCLDERGYVDSDAYAGPNRRVADRRTHDKLQKKRVWKEKMKFLNRSMLNFSFIFIAVVLSGVFLMAPEYARISHGPAGGATLNRYATARPAGGTIGAILNKVTAWFQDSSVTDAVSDAASSAVDMVVNPGSASFSHVLSNIAALRQQQGGNAAASQALDYLRSLLSDPNVRSPEDVNRAVGQARSNNKILDSLFGSVQAQDVGAAAMLLALNEFRSDISGNRPYADDLTLLKKLAGNDPRMNRALQHLAPYAESGIMNRQALQAELGGLAGDIVTAQIQGRDVSVQEAARRRFERLTRAGRIDKIQGATPDAVVARAQIMLDKGDVKGAMQELERLNGPSAQAARPWMNNAANYVIANQSSEELTQGVLQEISGTDGASMDDLISLIKQSMGGPEPYSPPLPKGSNGIGNISAPIGTAP